MNRHIIGRRRLAIGAIAALAAAILVAALVSRGGGHARAASATAHIAVLDRGTAPAAKLDDGVAATLTQTADKLAPQGSPNAASRTNGLDLSAAREALDVDGGPRVIAAPSTTGVCVVAVVSDPPGAATAACQAAAAFNAEGVGTVIGAPPSVDVVGLVPDGVSQVTIAFADGSTRDVPVKDNAYAARSTVATKSVSFEGPAGTSTHDATPAS